MVEASLRQQLQEVVLPQLRAEIQQALAPTLQLTQPQQPLPALPGCPEGTSPGAAVAAPCQAVAAAAAPVGAAAPSVPSGPASHTTPGPSRPSAAAAAAAPATPAQPAAAAGGLLTAGAPPGGGAEPAPSTRQPLKIEMTRSGDHPLHKGVLRKPRHGQQAQAPQAAAAGRASSEAQQRSVQPEATQGLPPGVLPQLGGFATQLLTRAGAAPQQAPAPQLPAAPALALPPTSHIRQLLRRASPAAGQQAAAAGGAAAPAAGSPAPGPAPGPAFPSWAAYKPPSPPPKGRMELPAEDRGRFATRTEERLSVDEPMPPAVTAPEPAEKLPQAPQPLQLHLQQPVHEPMPPAALPHEQGEAVPPSAMATEELQSAQQQGQPAAAPPPPAAGGAEGSIGTGAAVPTLRADEAPERSRAPAAVAVTAAAGPASQLVVDYADPNFLRGWLSNPGGACRGL